MAKEEFQLATTVTGPPRLFLVLRNIVDYVKKKTPSMSSAYNVNSNTFSTTNCSPGRRDLLSSSFSTTSNMSTMPVDHPPFACEFNRRNSSPSTTLTFTISVTNESGDEVLELNIVPPSPNLDAITVNDDLGSRMEALSISQGTTATYSPYSSQRIGGGYSMQ